MHRVELWTLWDLQTTWNTLGQRDKIHTQAMCIYSFSNLQPIILYTVEALKKNEIFTVMNTSGFNSV